MTIETSESKDAARPTAWKLECRKKIRFALPQTLLAIMEEDANKRDYYEELSFVRGM
jgi:hypothetical protein